MYSNAKVNAFVERQVQALAEESLALFYGLSH